MSRIARRIHYIDTHTGGEPTRVVISGGPELGRDDLARRRERFEKEFDHFREAIVGEPRGSQALVGALLCPPSRPGCVAGVIFFNSSGYLGMCGHGTIGVAIVLEHLGRTGVGSHRIETPVGVVTIESQGDQRISVANVACYRHRANVSVEVPGVGAVTGDVAYGGNWFFLVRKERDNLQLANVRELTSQAIAVRQALKAAGITGVDGAEIDHVEFFGPAENPTAQKRNFVLCPSDDYDRSPCGTGTSAKVACLAADGKLKPGDTWVQESITGSLFTAVYAVDPAQKDRVIPTITGEAYVTGEGDLLLDKRDPFEWGLAIGRLPADRPPGRK
jgi:4-hydroxyproline epimerase